MYIIVGLGNPGSKYENTRHNVGFMAIDRLATEFHIVMAEKKHKAIVGKGIVGGERVILAKPQTFMNLSGESVRELVDYYRIDAERDLIVLYDDISLEPGQLRIRKKGSAGGHNGIKNIILHLGHDVFQRIKIGVGEKPAGYNLADYVLGKFRGEDEEAIEDSLDRAVKATIVMMEEGPDKAMNQYNGKN